MQVLVRKLTQSAIFSTKFRKSTASRSVNGWTSLGAALAWNDGEEYEVRRDGDNSSVIELNNGGQPLKCAWS